MTDPAKLRASPVPAFAVPSSDAKGRAVATEGGRGHSLDLESRFVFVMDRVAGPTRRLT